MEDAQPLQQLLGEAPALAPVEEYGEDERLVDRRLGGPRDGGGGEEALAQRAEGLARRGATLKMGENGRCAGSR